MTTRNPNPKTLIHDGRYLKFIIALMNITITDLSIITGYKQRKLYDLLNNRKPNTAVNYPLQFMVETLLDKYIQGDTAWKTNLLPVDKKGKGAAKSAQTKGSNLIREYQNAMLVDRTGTRWLGDPEFERKRLEQVERHRKVMLKKLTDGQGRSDKSSPTGYQRDKWAL